MSKFRLDMYLAPNFPNEDELVGGYKVVLDPRKAIFRVTYTADVTYHKDGTSETDFNVEEMEIITGSSDTFQFVRLGQIFERMLMPLCDYHFQILYNSTRLQPIDTGVQDY